jgi:hypothetical protein
MSSTYPKDKCFSSIINNTTFATWYVNNCLSTKINSTLPISFKIEKTLLWKNEKIFQKLFNIIGLNPNMIDTDIIIGLMSYGDLIFQYSQLRKELLDVQKP